MGNTTKRALYLVSALPRHAHPAKASAPSGDQLPLAAILRHVDNLQLLAVRDLRFAKAILRATETSARRSARETSE